MKDELRERRVLSSLKSLIDECYADPGFVLKLFDKNANKCEISFNQHAGVFYMLGMIEGALLSAKYRPTLVFEALKTTQAHMMHLKPSDYMGTKRKHGLP